MLRLVAGTPTNYITAREIPTVEEILITARDSIQKKRDWCQFAFSRFDDKGNIQRCGRSAVLRGGRSVFNRSASRFEIKEISRRIDIALDLLDNVAWSLYGAASLTAVNDRLYTTPSACHAAVMMVYTQAIEQREAVQACRA